VEWYRLFLANPSAVEIEVMESFPKQTYRNRCTISQAISRKGDETIGRELLMLSVPVKRADSKQLTRDVEISYQQKWQHQHWIALMSAYKRTPYFDYYADYLRPFYEKETKYLVDLNAGLHEVIIGLITNNRPSTNRDSSLRFTSDWMRKDLEVCFGDGRSILDTLFEYGPETVIQL
jgi:hypothetical protein